jgi:hypothetical protein
MELEGWNGTMVDIYLYLDPELGYRLPVPRYAHLCNTDKFSESGLDWIRIFVDLGPVP